MRFLVLSFPLGPLDADGVEPVARLLGALAVTLTGASDEAVLEPAPDEVRLWPTTQVEVLFSGEIDSPAAIAALAAGLGIDPRRVRARDVEDRIWEREWLRDFRPMRFGRRLWVAPHQASVPMEDAVVVRLDPGLAFGTGTHASTALCLEWLDAHLQRGAEVIDYGCGSGILGIAALRLGAERAWCYDRDPQALVATADNAAANGLQDRVHVVASAAELPRAADVVLANILASTLCDLAPELAELTRPGGVALLAGLLEDEAHEVTRAYQPWFDCGRFGARDGWAALSARRRPPS